MTVKKETKNAIIGGAIALIVSLIGFVVNLFYTRISERPKLEIVDIKQEFEFQKQTNNIPYDIRLKFDTYRESAIVIKADFDSISEIIRKINLSRDEINILSQTVENCKKNFTGVKLCNVALKRLKKRTINSGDLSCLGVKNSIVGKNTNWQEIEAKVKDKLSIQEDIYNTYCCIYDSISKYKKWTCGRTGFLKLSITISNSGKTTAVIYPKKSWVSFLNMGIKYTSLDKKSIIYLEPFKSENNNSVSLIPSKESNSNITKWQNLVREGKNEAFTIHLETNYGIISKDTTLELP